MTDAKVGGRIGAQRGKNQIDPQAKAQIGGVEDHICPSNNLGRVFHELVLGPRSG